MVVSTQTETHWLGRMYSCQLAKNLGKTTAGLLDESIVQCWHLPLRSPTKWVHPYLGFSTISCEALAGTGEWSHMSHTKQCIWHHLTSLCVTFQQLSAILSLSFEADAFYPLGTKPNSDTIDLDQFFGVGLGHRLCWATSDDQQKNENAPLVIAGKSFHLHLLCSGKYCLRWCRKLMQLVWRCITCTEKLEVA